MPEFKMYPNLITDSRMALVAGRGRPRKEYLFDGKWMYLDELAEHSGIIAPSKERKRGILLNRIANHPLDAKYLLCEKPPEGLNFNGTDRYASRRKPRVVITGKPKWGDLRGKMSRAKKAVSDRLDIDQISEGSWENKHLKGA